MDTIDNFTQNTSVLEVTENAKQFLKSTSTWTKFFAIVMIFPALYLLRFSQNINKALASHDTLVMEEAFKNMKSFWKFNGIMVIVYFALVVPMLIIALIMSVA